MVGITREQTEERIEAYHRFARTLNDEQLAVRFSIGSSLPTYELEAMTREICVRFVGQQAFTTALATATVTEVEDDAPEPSNASSDGG